VPFAAIKAFLDPSVQFGLTFETGEVPAAAAPPAPPAPAPQEKAKADSAPQDKMQDQPAAEAADKPHDGEHKPSEGAEVVRLDRFRKK
jgi:hypothetical protein